MITTNHCCDFRFFVYGAFILDKNSNTITFTDDYFDWSVFSKSILKTVHFSTRVQVVETSPLVFCGETLFNDQ